MRHLIRREVKGGKKMIEEKPRLKKRSKRERVTKDSHYHSYIETDPRRTEKPPEVHYHYYYEPPRVKPGRSSKPGIAGALLIIAAVIGLIFSIAIIGMSTFVGDFGEGFEIWGVSDKGDVSGEITHLNGTPVENVTISIVGENLNTQTDSDGLYIIYNVPTGNQKIRIEKEGYNTIIYKAFISPSDSEWEDREKHDGKWETGNEFDFTISEGDQVLERGTYPPFGIISGFMIVCGIVMLVFSIIALIGGIYAIQRRNFAFAIAGAVLGILTVGGTLFALIALFILIISRNEFTKSTE